MLANSLRERAVALDARVVLRDGITVFLVPQRQATPLNFLRQQLIDGLRDVHSQVFGADQNLRVQGQVDGSLGSSFGMTQGDPHKRCA